MARNRIVFIKHSDCVSEYKHIYQKEYAEISDGPAPYLKQFISSCRANGCYDVSILSFGDRNSKLSPEKDLELRVVNDCADRKLIMLLRFVQNSFLLFAYLAKRRPRKIVSVGDVQYILVLLVYSYLSRSEVYLFLAGWIRGNVFLNKLTVRAIEKRVTRVFSLNKANVGILRSLGYSRECDIYRPRYRDISESQIKPTELREDANFKILFVGRLAPVKGMDILQQVALRTANQNITLYIIGNGPCFEDLMTFKRLNDLSDLKILGHMPNREIYSFIRDSDVGLMPSKSEGLGKTAAEFMIMETPIIASRVGGIPDIVRDGVNGFLVDPEDAEGFCRRIEQLCNDRHLLLDLSRGTWEAKAQVLDCARDFSYYLRETIL